MKHLIFNPFQKIAGFPALILGLLMLVLTSYLSGIAQVHFDGVLDVHFANSSFVMVLLESLVNIIIAAIFIYFSGMLASASRVRIIDVLGTISLSRAPLVLIPFSTLFIPAKEITDNVRLQYMNGAEELMMNTSDWVLILLLAFVTLFAIVWYLVLLYNAYRVSCNAKGGKAIALFIGAIILAEIGSKIILINMIRNL